MQISTFYSEDNKRKAIIEQFKYGYNVLLFEKGGESKVVSLDGKSLRYAEDLAENFVTYVGAYALQ